jgi:aspartate racemase
MKTIGLIGGTSWVSTIDYYTQLNEKVNLQLGGLEYPRILIYSLNYGEIKRNNDRNDWDANFSLILPAVKNHIKSGAQGIVLCANTMHLLADRIQAEIDVPVINIATATAQSISKSGIRKVGLLGTRFTMERPFFHEKLKEKNIEAIIPEEADRAFIHHTIFEELGRGLVKDDSKERYLDIIAQLSANGAEGIILGCTEIPLIVKPGDVSQPLFDTTNIHTDAAVEFILGKV